MPIVNVDAKSWHGKSIRSRFEEKIIKPEKLMQQQIVGFGMLDYVVIMVMVVLELMQLLLD